MPCISNLFLKLIKMAKLLVFSHMTQLIYQKQKYGGEVEDHNAYLIPDIISKDTFNGEHISEYKHRHQQQEKLQTPTIADESQLKPMEP